MRYLCLDCGNVFHEHAKLHRVNYKDPDDGHIDTFIYCPISSCEGDVIELDDNMVEVVKMLNNKGYITKYTCGGHANDSVPSIYIMFDKEYIDVNNLEIPRGFKVESDMNIIRYRADGNNSIDNQVLLNGYHTVLCTWVVGLKDLSEGEL